MLSSAEEELSDEVAALRALLHRERRARSYRSEVQQMLVDTSHEIDPSGVADVLASGFTEIVESSWVCVAFRDADNPNMMRLQFGPTMPNDVAADWARTPLSADIPMAAVLRGEVETVELPDRAGFDRWPPFAAAASEAGIGSFHCLPIKNAQNNTVSAVIGLAWNEPHSLEPDDRVLLEEILVNAAPAFERARVSAVDRQVATTLQQWLLPPSLPEIDQLDIATVYTPGRDELTVGGDWYEVIEIDGSTTAIVVGDVVGHNVRAAAEMGQVRHVLASSLLATGGDPAESLRHTDAYFSRRSPDTMASAIVVVFRLDASGDVGEMVISSAGHLPPIVTDPGTASRLIETDVGPPVGAGLGGYGNVVRDLPPGALLTAFTDGVVERRDEVIDDSLLALCREIDHAVSLQTVGTAATISSRLVAEVLERRIDGGAGDDDAAALVVKRF